MTDLKSFLRRLSVAAEPSSIRSGDAEDFLAEHKHILPDLLLGLFKIGAIEGSFKPKHPAHCELCDQPFNGGMPYVKGRAYWGPEPKRLKGFEPVPMCLDCHFQCGDPIGPNAELYLINERGHSWLVAGWHRFDRASIDGGKTLI
jgi:hypothetical protein